MFVEFFFIVIGCLNGVAEEIDHFPKINSLWYKKKVGGYQFNSLIFFLIINNSKHTTH